MCPYENHHLTMMAWAGCAAGVFAQTSRSTGTRDRSFRPIGLARPETAQLNAVNVATASSGGTAASCTGTISFLNASGTVIGSAANFTVTTGQISSASLPFAKSVASGRTEIRGVVTLTESANAPAPCDLEISRETFDATGVTKFISQGLATQVTEAVRDRDDKSPRASITVG
ncbi:MAG TPA: hypothetical protein VKB88_06025 [Bryobacteraceae bacterium]|nr:hypothetical protein [Bryobacteraceae bacterium]